jgi:hypothetical protein
LSVNWNVCAAGMVASLPGMWSCPSTWGPAPYLLISEPERGKLSLVIQMLKQITSRKLRSKAHPPAKDAGRVGQAAKNYTQKKGHGFYPCP